MTLTPFLTEKFVSCNKTSGSPCDIVPPGLLKEVFPTLGPHILNIINSSLTSGQVPKDFKHAVVHPVHLDSSILANFRPVSKLPFLSKVLEKIV